MQLPEAKDGTAIAIEANNAKGILLALYSGDFNAIIRTAEKQARGLVGEVYFGDGEIGLYVDLGHNPPPPPIRT